jgi:putative lipoic acid-binding regulatory protein
LIDLNKHKLELEYPCNWKYKIVIIESINVKYISKDIFGERDHKVKESNVSKKGKFKSYNIELIVHSDDDREEIHRLLGEHKDIKMVL